MRIFLLLNNNLKDSNSGNVRKFVTLSIIFWTIYSYLYRQVVGISMGTCARLVADSFFLFCCERDFMLLFYDNNQAYVVEAFNSTSRYI